MSTEKTNTEDDWTRVDRYLIDTLVAEDDALRAARESSVRTTMPHVEVSPTQGALLALLVRMAGARRVLEFGTLAGYSAIWLARAAGEESHVDTLELEPQNAEVARANLEEAGVGERVRIHLGPAAESAEALIAAAAEPYDFVFIDADKPNNARYLRAAMELTRPGSVIVVDNVIRGGAVADADSPDPRVQGAREALAAAGADPRLSTTALQTVGVKGWDGFAVLRRER